MIHNPNIAIVYGGNSSEFEVSVKSSENILTAIDKDKFTPWMIEIKENQWHVIVDKKKVSSINKDNFSFIIDGETIKISYAYIIVHGTPGEDGILQGYFDLLNIPYSTGGVDSCALTFNKWFCNNHLRQSGITVAQSLLVKKDSDFSAKDIVEQLGLPIFIKPNSGGSSFGVTKVENIDEIKEALEKAWNEDSDALIEQLIDGDEFTCGVICYKNHTVVLPVTEIIYENEFFDYEAKYIQSRTQEITPARLKKELYKNCQKISEKVAELTLSRGIVRVDFILKDNTFYCLEINAIPGMTATSFIPQQIEAANLNLKEIITNMIEGR